MRSSSRRGDGPGATRSVSVHADKFYMDRALAVAERGRGRTSPNPMVGAVVVDPAGVVVGAGCHELAGGPHAEVHALRAAGERARGATLYCTLEPCSHVGRTAPCAPLVADAGVARVVAAVEDPNPRVSGRGFALLRERGVEVATGVRAAEAEALNRAFFSVMRHGRPFVTMKVALSRDGRVCAAPGVRTPLTGPSANRLIHRERAEVDALAIGSGTVLADDPLLTARGAYRYRPLTRVVFDARLRTPPHAKLFSTLPSGPVIIVTTAAAARSLPDRVAALAAAGAEIVALPSRAGVDDAAAAGRVASAGISLPGALTLLAARGVSSLIVEGGPTLHGAFWDAGLVDRVQIFRTPHAVGAQGLEWLPAVEAGRGWTPAVPRAVGEDWLVEGYVHRID